MLGLPVFEEIHEGVRDDVLEFGIFRDAKGPRLQPLIDIILRRLCQTEPLVVIDEYKIEDRRLGFRVPWQDVEAVWVDQVYPSQFLRIEVEEPSNYTGQSSELSATLLRAIARLNPVHDASQLAVSFKELEPGLEEAWQYIQQIEPDRAQ